MWLAHEFKEVFGVQERLTGETAQAIYDQIQERLESPEFRPGGSSSGSTSRS